jgi:hypothetical protein
MNTDQPPYSNIQYMGKPFSTDMDEAAQQTIHNVAGVLMPLAEAMEDWPSGYIDIKDTGSFTVHLFPPQLHQRIIALLR